MINTQKIQEKVEEISAIELKLEALKAELKSIPDGYIYIIADHDMVLNSNCVNFRTALEELEKWSNDEMVNIVTLWTNNPLANGFDLASDYYFVKFANISELQDLSEGKG